jgi:GH15 family glucan-1,4-alpha-glucosidase
VYHFGLVGNCQVSALISARGAVEWLCLPRPDSDPVFGSILDPDGGIFEIEGVAGKPRTVRQYYEENTNILVTELALGDDVFRVTDFCPRFEQHGRMFRPLSLFRIVEPISGCPRIKVRCAPITGWDKKPAAAHRGNSHFRYDVRGGALRLTTNMPLTYMEENTPFQLQEKTYFALTWDWGLEEDLPAASERFLLHTRDYWRLWVKHCSIPTLFQRQTIRSALALKLHCYDDTGAILASMSTSLPEEVGNGRNWDYRFCWLRDSYFVLNAFHNLGHFEEMEGFLKFLIDIVQQLNEDARLAPVYTLSRGLPLPENVHGEWRGYQDSGPVRSNNQAGEHVQNDIYGEMILTLAPIFLDERFVHLRTADHENLLSRLTDRCIDSIRSHDAGLWEVRHGHQEHSFTNLMCWAALDRLHKIQEEGYLRLIKRDLAAEKSRAFGAIRGAVFEDVVRNGPRDRSLDASLALMRVLRFPDGRLTLQTLKAIRSGLAAERDREAFFYRYLRPDDFGKPKSAFVICSFWVAQAFGLAGHTADGLNVLAGAMSAANELGLFAEHFDPNLKIQLGNFPQAYSHVGQINAAFAVSPPWSEVL